MAAARWPTRARGQWGSPSTTAATLTRHVFANGAATRGATILSSSAALAARLNAVNSKLFPLHRLGGGGGGGRGRGSGNGGRGGGDAAAGLAPSAPPPCPRCRPAAVAGGNLLRFHLRPASRLGVDASAVPAPLDVSAIQEELRSAHAGILEEAARAAAEAEEATKSERSETATAGGR